MPDTVARHIRERKLEITDAWERVVRIQLPAIAQMSRPMLLDHLPELLEGLAAYIEGNKAIAERAFEALVQGHAVQRLGWGIGLESLTHEYMHLRAIVLRDVLAVVSPDNIRESLVRMNEALDLAVSRALEYYGAQRDVIRDRFISILGHDLRGPLSTIAMAATMMATSSTIDPKTLGTRIAAAAERMGRMVEDVLDFARGHLGGGIPSNPKLDNLGDVARVTVEEVQQAHPDRPIHLECEGDLRGPIDRDRMQQALTNLIINAIQHGTGEIRVRVFEASDHGMICCAVTNRGKQIPSEQIPRLFDPFARAGSMEARTGLGLGLYIVDQIVLAHGGMCDVESNEDATTFTIRMPRVPDNDRLEMASPAPTR